TEVTEKSFSPEPASLCSLRLLLFNSALSSQKPTTNSQKLKLPPTMMMTKITAATASIQSRLLPISDGIKNAQAASVSKAVRPNTSFRRRSVLAGLFKCQDSDSRCDHSRPFLSRRRHTQIPTSILRPKYDVKKVHNRSPRLKAS